MNIKTIKIIDQCRTVVATAQVSMSNERFAGWIDLGLMPSTLQQTFEEYEEIINGQMFSFLDELEEQISAMQLKVLFNEGDEAAVEDLQIYPSSRRVSFKIVKEQVDLVYPVSMAVA